MKYDVTYFTESLKKMNILLSDAQIEQFLCYYELLIEKNKVMNLTAITDFNDVIEKHFLDSLSLIHVIDLCKPYKVMDLGTGAGFPGIPLKIAFPNLRITLADSLNKRIHFLDEVIDRLKLENIETIHGRAEDIARLSKCRETYDLCVSRAVANLSVLAEYCLPFVKIGGSFISYKSGECDEEAASAKSSIFLLGGKIKEIRKFKVGTSKRAFIIIDKKKATSKKYPRKAGMPSKNPL